LKRGISRASRYTGLYGGYRYKASVDGGGEGEGEGEGISGGDIAGYGGSGDIGGREYKEEGYNSGESGLGLFVKEKEGCKGGCNSGEKGFEASVKEVRSFFFLFPSFLSAVIACVFGAIASYIVVCN